MLMGRINGHSHWVLFQQVPDGFIGGVIQVKAEYLSKLHVPVEPPTFFQITTNEPANVLYP